MKGNLIIGLEYFVVIFISEVAIAAKIFNKLLLWLELFYNKNLQTQNVIWNIHGDNDNF